MKKLLLGAITLLFVSERLTALVPLLPSQPQSYPLFSGGLPYLPSLVPLEENEREFELSANWWNAFRYDFQQFSDNFTLVDAEGLFLSLQFRQDLGRTWSLGLRLEVQSVFAGVLDVPIEGFHQVFGLPNQGRENRPQNLLRIYHNQGGTPVIDLIQSFTDLNLLYLWLEREIYREREVRLGLMMGFKPPLPWGRLNSVSSGINLGFSYFQGISSLGLWWGSQLGLGFQSTPFLPPEGGWNAILQWGASLGWQAAPWLALVARLDIQNSPYVGDASVSSGRQGNSLIAAAWKLADSTWLVTGLQEEGLSWAGVEVGFLIYLVYRHAPWVYDEL